MFSISGMPHLHTKKVKSENTQRSRKIIQNTIDNFPYIWFVSLLRYHRSNKRFVRKKKSAVINCDSNNLKAAMELPFPFISGDSETWIISSALPISPVVLTLTVSLILALQPFSWIQSPRYFSFSEWSIITPPPPCSWGHLLIF